MIAFPMRYATGVEDDSVKDVGILCFDSPVRHAFGKIPCIFAANDVAKYRDSIEQHVAFQLGAILADLLGSAFRNIIAPHENLMPKPHTPNLLLDKVVNSTPVLPEKNGGN